tara:strand:+ start:292 stop:552 length:261 start_codon:yes stop_codon:yes gene_type:complete
LREIAQIENYLNGTSSGEERVLMEAQLLLHPSLREDLENQQLTYQVVKEYGREKIREKIRMAEQNVFTAPSYRGFRKKIKAIFSKT